MKGNNLEEKLKDRRDYRAALINRREEVDKKIAAVEGQIKTLKSE
jgi:hypothetical protein